MDLKGLLHRELCEGMTEEQVASSVGVSVGTVQGILTGNSPQRRAIWEKFARYFRMDIEFLRTGASTYIKQSAALSHRPSHAAAGHIRNIPLIDWHRLPVSAKSGDLPGTIQAEAMVEATDLSGTRTFALRVPDDSMEPFFSKDEMIFVNPEMKWKEGDFVVATRDDNGRASTLLRQIKGGEERYRLHPVNSNYEDLPLTRTDCVWGRVVRLRKNL